MDLKKEIVKELHILCQEIDLSVYNIFLFGYCNATLALAEILLDEELCVKAILDNSEGKQKEIYKGIGVCYPEEIFNYIEKPLEDNSIVLIASRFYASMYKQLRDIGYKGIIRKVIDYNTYADYSLSEQTFCRMKNRVEIGNSLLNDIKEKYSSHFIVFFPFAALGDVYTAMTYWEEYSAIYAIDKVVFCVPIKPLADVIRLFGEYQVVVKEQKELDSMVQAALYLHDENTFIAHHDRPYVIDIHRALRIKKIVFDKIYCCGVFGLPANTRGRVPTNFSNYPNLTKIPKGKSVIISPYAKSVVPVADDIWNDIVEYYKAKGYECFTNISGTEIPLTGTEAISPNISEIKSVVEWAGTFVGIRSGLCDVLREAKANKIALYPDYYYCDTKWKAIDIYCLEGWKNLVVGGDFKWKE